MLRRPILVATLALAAMAPLHAQTTMTTTTTQTSAYGCYDIAAVAGLAVEPAQPVVGQSSTIRLKIKNVCGTTKSIPWEVSVDGTVVGSGTVSVGAGTTVDRTASWTAKLGAHEINAELDPNNTLGESTQARNNNLPTVVNVTVSGDWNAWAGHAKAALGPAIQEWFTKAQFKDVRVNGPGAYDGYLSGPGIDAMLKSRIVAAGVPAEVADAFANGINDKWSQWRGSVKFPSTSLPMFGPAPVGTTKMPSIGAPPIATLSQDVNALSATNINTAIKNRLGALASLSGATNATSDVAQAAYACYARVNTVPVINLMATGVTAATTVGTPVTFTGKADGIYAGHILLPGGTFC